METAYTLPVSTAESANNLTRSTLGSSERNLRVPLRIDSRYWVLVEHVALTPQYSRSSARSFSNAPTSACSAASKRANSADRAEASSPRGEASAKSGNETNSSRKSVRIANYRRETGDVDGSSEQTFQGRASLGRCIREARASPGSHLPSLVSPDVDVGVTDGELLGLAVRNDVHLGRAADQRDFAKQPNAPD